MKILPVLFAILALSNASINNSEATDRSLANKEYYQKGVPKNIHDPDDLVAAYNALRSLSGDNESCLPRYNSVKSQEVFSKLFNRDLINIILSNDLPPQEKRVVLTKLWTIYGDFSALYDMKNQDHIYDNESLRIYSLSTFALISTFVLMDNEIREGNVDLSVIWENPEEKILSITKMVGQDLWGLDYRIKITKKLDNQTKMKLKNDYDEYFGAAKSIKFLDYENNIKKIDNLF